MRWEQSHGKGALLAVVFFTALATFWVSRYKLRRITAANSHLATVGSTDSSCDRLSGLIKFLRRCGGQHRRYVSYQPPGNGWNNQRAVFEAALVIARLLNRTLIAQPVTSHAVVMAEKKRYPKHIAGYKAYNRVDSHHLLPLSRLLDFGKINKRPYSPVLEWQLSHEKFRSLVKQLGWKERQVCHSAGFGYWIDQLNLTSRKSRHMRSAKDETIPPELHKIAFKTSSVYFEQESIPLLKNQAFEVNYDWTSKCEEEREWFEMIKRGQREGRKNPILVRALLDELKNANEELIYFEEGTLFAIDVRFRHASKAREAQLWTRDIHYHHSLKLLAKKALRRMPNLDEASGEFDAVHIRRGDHPIRHVSPEYWLRLMASGGISRSRPVFTASDETNRTWFNDIIAEGYSLVFLEDLINISQELISLGYPQFFHQDAASMVEQLVCENAGTFVGSEHSTLSLFVMRKRQELPVDGGLLVSGTRIRWLGHTTKERYYYHGIHLPGITDLT